MGAAITAPINFAHFLQKQIDITTQLSCRESLAKLVMECGENIS